MSGMSWTPLFAEITESSVWMEPQHVRLAWITFLAKKDYKDHTYETNAYLLAKAANITEAEAEDAIRVLMSPDKKSRSQENEGRRLELIEGNLYRVLSGDRYLEKMRRAKKQLADRERQSNKRAKDKESQFGCAVATMQQSASEWHVAFGLDLPERLQTKGCLGAVKFWLQYKAERGESYKPTGLKTALMRWSDQFSPEELSVSIRESMSNNWKGVFRPREAVESNGEYIPNNG